MVGFLLGVGGLSLSVRDGVSVLVTLRVMRGVCAGTVVYRLVFYSTAQSWVFVAGMVHPLHATCLPRFAEWFCAPQSEAGARG
mmetsp:Transcript_71373/g.163598  ORF Transcript_71373/g.163598 Transcript_71373/m.163598 type:complete len:83 (+) Transcript_71373:390-638(+)